MPDVASDITTALAWCLAWGEEREPRFSLDVLQQMLAALKNKAEIPEEVRELVAQVRQLQGIAADYFPENLTQLKNEYPDLWNQPARIGLVYGGATKIKGYVFESAKLQDIRGASALLDKINLVDLPDFFHKEHISISKWLARYFPGLEAALIPELIIYSTGGNILAFCPAAYVHDLANAIERRYTEETLTANSCAVGDSFRLLEFRFGLLRDSIENTPWLDWYRDNPEHPLVEAYFGRFNSELDGAELFKNRKSFNELVGKLAAKFNVRRSGNDLPNEQRPSRRYPPMFETHPYIVRDESDRRSAIAPANLPDSPWFSDALARKRIMGQSTKLENAKAQGWYYKNSKFKWQFGNIRRWWRGVGVESWVRRFDEFLKPSQQQPLSQHYYGNTKSREVQQARTLKEIGNGSQGFVAYIYADGNNMGGYIQKIRTPEAYKKFSKDVSDATEQAVYIALATHLHPRRLENLPVESDSKEREGILVHPFEIIAIGGDDVLLIVPADKALEIAKTIGDEFEKILARQEDYRLSVNEQSAKSVECHRYVAETAQPSKCRLSMSMGVLIAADNTPIYYAQNLTEQLLKSAKKKAKELNKPDYKYTGGTVDLLTLKSVTMISSNIQLFRETGLTKQKGATLKLYAAPYTLHELGGLVKTVQALQKSGFPRSQLYQIRSLLEQGKHTAILNYRYFRVRLGAEEQKLLRTQFEESWCQPRTNNGNLAPWMFQESSTYETIWRELVDIYPFIEEASEIALRSAHATQTLSLAMTSEVENATTSNDVELS